MPNRYPIISHREPGLVGPPPSGTDVVVVHRSGDGTFLPGPLPGGQVPQAATEVDARPHVGLAVLTEVTRYLPRRFVTTIQVDFVCSVLNPVTVAQNRRHPAVADLPGFLAGLVQAIGEPLPLEADLDACLVRELQRQLDPLTGTHPVFGMRIEVGKISSTSAVRAAGSRPTVSHPEKLVDDDLFPDFGGFPWPTPQSSDGD
ncbi:hypothetical protein KIH74_11515 [Kineosporia sp. J2-2]|uniref:Uncharacterized protein n=1 Tax=Kineosporia corallincola TaxID=2835133 RepID=A0ABS5TFD2_9ACTN|nr:hypothetical protein [Kineosporia corallincola]MBT0769553.1 hypothetical protein [Kineosporia corallincola]